MLARHADNIFWAARHMERADYTARMLDVAFHAAVQDGGSGAAHASRALLQVLRLEKVFDKLYDEASPEGMAEFLLVHPENPGSVLANIDAARENLRITRELVSSEMWEAANRAHLELRRQSRIASIPRSPYRFMSIVRERCQTVAGVANQTMPRDDAFSFMDLGYMIERAIMTLRLVRVRSSLSGSTFDDWAMTLHSTGSLESFQRVARGSTDQRDVIEFLLANPAQPRSVLFCLSEAEQSLGRLAGIGERRRPQRLLGRVRSDLDFADLDDMTDSERSDFLTKLEVGLRDVADAIGFEFFQQGFEPIQGAVSVPPGVIA